MRGFLLALTILAAVITAGCSQTGTTAPSGSPEPSSGESDGATTGSSGGTGDFLVNAIQSANPGDTINIPAGTYTFTGGELVIDKDVTLAGAGADSTILQAAESSGAATHRVIRVPGGSNVTITDVTIRFGVEASKEERMIPFHALIGGFASIWAEYGGGIYNQGTLRLINTIVTGNAAGGGAGIFNGGRMTIFNSEITGNVADGKGGGIFSGSILTLTQSTVSDNQAGSGGGLENHGNLTMTDTAVRGNSADFEGGGVNNSFVGTMAMSATTLSGNSAWMGGGLINWGQANVINSTISDNSAVRGGGIENRSLLALANSTVSDNQAKIGGGLVSRPIHRRGITEVLNTILAGNLAEQGPDCFGDLTSLGHNILGDGKECDLMAAEGDRIGTAAQPIDAMLGPLGANGGPTDTHALLEGSPAIDRGSGRNASCPITDQRGVSRSRSVACDIGAYEW